MQHKRCRHACTTTTSLVFLFRIANALIFPRSQELFAAGYGACFQSAMNASAMSMKMHLPADSVVETTVHLVGDMKALDMGLRVDMKVHKPDGISREQMEKIVQKAKDVCPYSRATKGNVETKVELI